MIATKRKKEKKTSATVQVNGSFDGLTQTFISTTPYFNNLIQALEFQEVNFTSKSNFVSKSASNETIDFIGPKCSLKFKEKKAGETSPARYTLW